MGGTTSKEDEVIIDVNGEYHRRKSAAPDPNEVAGGVEKKDEAEAADVKPATADTADAKRGFVAAKDDDWQHADIYTRSAPGPKKASSSKAKTCLFFGTCFGVCACCTK